MGNEHFTNIPVEIWAHSSNMYNFFGLSSDLRRIPVHYGKIGD